jgi:O-acetyl-ADP-ribose deacetylase (regulator of RNase III)
MIHYIKGDATDPSSRPAIIAHVVNDVGAWGRGFVLAISKRWKKPELMYRAWYMASRSWIGEAGTGFRLGATQLIDVEPSIKVANMVAQHGIGRNAGYVPLQYDALRECLRKLRLAASLYGSSVHMPRIGCGLAGGSWDVVGPIVERELDGVDVTVYDIGADR